MVSEKHLFDTNALLHNPDYVNKVINPLVPYTVLQELDKIKMEKDSERGWQARRAVRMLKNNPNVMFVELKLGFFKRWFKSNVPFKNNDDLIVQSAKDYNATVVTGDFLMQLKSKARGLNIIDIFEVMMGDVDAYKGYLEVTLDQLQMAYFHENPMKNIFSLHTNQYLVIRNMNGDISESLRWDGVQYHNIRKKDVLFTTNQFGDFNPKDIYQTFAMDSLMNDSITQIKGRAGSGKSLLSLNFAMRMLEKTKRDRLICFVNPMATRNSVKLGYYPGSKNEKLLDGTIGSMLGSKFGDKEVVQEMIDRNKLILLPFSDIRGFDTTGMNAIVYIIEAQNLDVELMKLAIQRVGDDGKLIIDGDCNTQVDSVTYEGSRNGMRRVSEVFRGEDYYGEVELPIIYRSKMGAKADEM